MMAAAKYASRRSRRSSKKRSRSIPKYVEARFGLVQVYANAPGIMGGSYDKAFEHAKAIKAIDPIVGHRAYAFIYTQQKKLDLAKKEYARRHPRAARLAEGAQPTSASTSRTPRRTFAAAFAELETAVKLDPSYMPACYHLGRTASLANANLRARRGGAQEVRRLHAEGERADARQRALLPRATSTRSRGGKRRRSRPTRRR